MLNIFDFLLNSLMLKKIAERKINNTCKCLKLCESKKLKNIIVKWLIEKKTENKIIFFSIIEDSNLSITLIQILQFYE